MRARIAVPATVANLGPGFDVLALALELQNEVEVEQTGERGTSVDPGPGAPPELQDPGHNLVVRAYLHACAAIGVPGNGVSFRCVNRIPLRRGLGSSAAAALGGVLAAVSLHRPPWDESAILERVVELEGHPDNAAAALLGGLVIAAPGAPPVTMRVPEELLAVVFIPDLELATAEARRVVAESFSRADAIFNAARCALLIRAIAERDYGSLRDAMQDRWHQRQRTELLPALPDLISAALDGGASGAALAGAGPSVMALTYRDPERVQEAMASAARRHQLRGRSIVSRVRNWGARVDVGM
ncbi:MAG: homoserine kinase [Chloroflexi bacterium]|nr:MAG: homoserine kinase [Chloroflexota bacterium]